MSNKVEVIFGTTKRSNKKYWFFASELDDVNMLYPASMLLNKCQEEYAQHHGVSLDSLTFIDID